MEPLACGPTVTVVLRDAVNPRAVTVTVSVQIPAGPAVHEVLAAVGVPNTPFPPAHPCVHWYAMASPSGSLAVASSCTTPPTAGAAFETVSAEITGGRSAAWTVTVVLRDAVNPR